MAHLPQPTDLAVLADLKQYLGLAAGVGPDDDLLQMMLSNLSARMLKLMSRDAIKSASYTETYDGTNTPTLALRHFPVSTVASVSINNTPIVLSPDGVQTGFTFDEFTVKLVGATSAWAFAPGFYGAPATFLQGRQNVVVSYTAGYAANSLALLELSEACFEWVAYKYRGRGWIGQKSKHLGTGESVTFDTAGTPEFVKEVIEPYIRRIPV